MTRKILLNLSGVKRKIIEKLLTKFLISTDMLNFVGKSQKQYFSNIGLLRSLRHLSGDTCVPPRSLLLLKLFNDLWDEKGKDK